MLRNFLRLGALITAPLLIATAANAQQTQYRGDTAPEEAALLLFSGENYGGDVREIFEPIANLPDLRFNDAARSIAVLAGQWEVCEHGDFTGRCVFLREDVPDLGWFGLSGEVSSVRPIFEYTDAQHGLMFDRDRNGYIRYADNQRYDSGYYDDGYGQSTQIIVQHYGYSPKYRQYGYYDPFSGFGPYGYGWGYSDAYGHRGYAYSDHRRPRRTHRGARNGDIILYRHDNGRGDYLAFNDEVRDLSRYRFNDQVSSINVRAGQWEVCEHANFQGRCRIVDASNGVLNLNGFNDVTSSIRRVGDRPAPRPGAGRGHGDRVGRGGRDGRDGRDDRDGYRDRPGGSGAAVVRPGGGQERRVAPSGVSAVPPRAVQPPIRRSVRLNEDLAGGPDRERRDVPPFARRDRAEDRERRRESAAPRIERSDRPVRAVTTPAAPRQPEIRQPQIRQPQIRQPEVRQPVVQAPRAAAPAPRVESRPAPAPRTEARGGPTSAREFRGNRRRNED